MGILSAHARLDVFLRVHPLVCAGATFFLPFRCKCVRNARYKVAVLLARRFVLFLLIIEFFAQDVKRSKEGCAICGKQSQKGSFRSVRTSNDVENGATLCSNAYSVTHGQIVHRTSLQLNGFESESRITERKRSTKLTKYDFESGNRSR